MPDRSYEWYHYYPDSCQRGGMANQKKVKAIAGTWPAIDHSLHFGVGSLGKCNPQLNADYKKEKGKDIPKEFIWLYEGCFVSLLKPGSPLSMVLVEILTKLPGALHVSCLAVPHGGY